MKERLNAFWQKHFAADLFPVDGNDVAIEEKHVQGLEEMSTKIDALTAENNQLKEENQAHAELIENLQETTDAGGAFAAAIVEALEANNVELPEGTDITAVVVEKINAWGKTVPAATAVVPTGADNLGDSTEPDYLTAFDKRELARRNRNKK